MKPFTIYPVVPQLRGLLVATYMESSEGVCMFKGMTTHQFRRSRLHINFSSSVIGGTENKAAARDEADGTVF
jgi:superfamily I DNA and/or RNA helicase